MIAELQRLAERLLGPRAAGEWRADWYASLTDTERERFWKECPCGCGQDVDDPDWYARHGGVE